MTNTITGPTPVDPDRLRAALVTLGEQLAAGKFSRFHSFWSGIHAAAQTVTKDLPDPGPGIPGQPYAQMLGAICDRLAEAAECSPYSLDVSLRARYKDGKLGTVIAAAIDSTGRPA